MPTKILYIPTSLLGGPKAYCLGGNNTPEWSHNWGRHYYEIVNPIPIGRGGRQNMSTKILYIPTPLLGGPKAYCLGGNNAPEWSHNWGRHHYETSHRHTVVVKNTKVYLFFCAMCQVFYNDLKMEPKSFLKSHLNFCTPWFH